MKSNHAALSLAFSAALFSALPACAQALKSGEEVYKRVCFACHAEGVANAPKFGDKAKWAPLLKEGQVQPTAHGWVGVRGMPPKGGREDLKLEEFARAAAYMARTAGGKWQDPDAGMMKRIEAEVKRRIEADKKKAKK